MSLTIELRPDGRYAVVPYSGTRLDRSPTPAVSPERDRWDYRDYCSAVRTSPGSRC
ncbi:hypothetical protein [Xylanimonas protaetiae]|uniref:hypothetical protein n=1 Tax=Xylanimonas protaetiae TaxID=2509457 RepID=UPI0013EE1F8A|nr:hypothetical protein [Xylanimonas protaetiae]